MSALGFEFGPFKLQLRCFLRVLLEFRSGLLLLRGQDLDDKLIGGNQVHSRAGNPDRLEGLKLEAPSWRGRGLGVKRKDRRNGQEGR